MGAGRERPGERTGEPFRTEYRLISKDSRAIWLRDEAVLIRDGADGYWQGVMLDRTERKEAKHALRQNEERFRALAQNASDIV